MIKSKSLINSKSFASLCGLILIAFLPFNPAHAQATRTFVSGIGDDGNSCLRATPCKTFFAAYQKTQIGGEITVLDPAGYGSLTVTSSISINNDGVGEAGVLVLGTNGIVISAAATDVVNLRGITFDGLNDSFSGVLILQAARVNIENCLFQEMGGSQAGLAGVNVAPSSGTVDVEIINTTIRNNTSGIIVKPDNGATVNLTIDHSRINNNSGGGLKVDGTAGGTISVSVSDSSISHNGGNGLNAVSATPGKAVVNLTRDVIAQNGVAGVQANAASGGTATVNVHASSIENNANALQSVGNGNLNTAGDNFVVGTLGSGFTGTVGLR